MKSICIIAITLVGALSVKGQAVANNELKGLINQSFTYYPKIKEVQNGVETARQRLVIAKNNLPEVDANASYNYVQPKIVLPLEVNGKQQDFQFAPVHNLNANLGGNYTLFDFGRLKANIERAKADIQYAEHATDNAKSQLANQVANIYYNIIYFQRGISIEDSVIAYLNENKRVIESKLRNGEAIKLDLLSIQSQIDAEANRQLDLQNALQKQQNLLENTTGGKAIAGAGFDFELPLKAVTEALADAQISNPEFLLAADRVKQSQNDIDIARLGTRPSVNVGANAGIKNGYVPNVNEMRFNYGAGISLKLPIYDGNRTKQKVRLSETVLQQNKLALETLNSNYRRDIQQALIDIQSNQDRIANTAGQIAQAQTAQELAASRFKNGVGTNLEITNASTNVARAQFSRLQYEYQLCLAKVELVRLMGYKYW
ncbi:MAG TPA: TolC family protein [Chitinophagaceae bacterium]|nr:TolC family protein [Chitinophagaceae bacterium]